MESILEKLFSEYGLLGLIAALGWGLFAYTLNILIRVLNSVLPPARELGAAMSALNRKVEVVPDGDAVRANDDEFSDSA